MGDSIEAVAERLFRAESVLFITGAGLSADSGLPTYRGVGGLYEDARTDEGLPIEVALSGQMLQQRPELCWKYIRRIEEACRGASFNRGHEVIALLEQRLGHCCVLTQNVDGFHRAAGSRNVIEIHGNVHRLICVACESRESVADFRDLAAVPSCGACGGLIRPEVVLFGEMLPALEMAQLSGELSLGFDMVFSVGTTSVFPYIAEPVLRVAAAGGTTVEINPGTTEVSEIVDFRIRCGAAEALDRLVRARW
ncbi:MAG: NAD-dependent protein deacylase [Planctomycetota bacterium]